MTKVSTEIANKEVTEQTNMVTINHMLSVAEQIVASKMTPHTKKETALAAMLMGRALKVPDIVAVNHIYSVNGNTTVDVHLVNMVLDRAGVIRKILKYAEPVWEYRDNVGITYTERHVLDNQDKYQLISNTAKKENYDTKRIQILRVPVVLSGTQQQDKETVIYFSRKLQQPDNSWVEVELTHSFKYSDAVARGLANKDNWQKMLPTMLYTRCLVEGGRRIAADHLMGAYEFSELADPTNIKYNYTEDGSVKTVDAEVTVISDEKTEKSQSTTPAE